ncbi:hypothetical protein WJ0W_000939 [Paenibacillus melissococcoides]|uniref:Uncharacterized protein n=1 Tax=Paenibacillus melissococcoides TaxID=2912268 RepID=A0ABM9FXI8_9BACL|nr:MULTISPECIES: hypothetical protein [Paenibacillus]MEB9896075.1 hypothetical protein [Bacillus cereus]CAH8243699.1 hypothetical protein WJ0W_000939 [Paenibacillus melissococcoides]CAH8704856.1 hypothetical protein HTL2_000712 [Paenibacillus melissococcoides]CAH8707629.1 hypothetical protein WDD9_001675 [Paenibacillus melissococcoides]GIO77500.1 hypothetical protein J6TS7_11100 [Paenibacillus dendritiformis]
MNDKELREKIAASCRQYDSLYGKLVAPINDMLIEMEADISEKTANQIIENLTLFHEGEKYIADCHLDESNNFMEDGIQQLKRGNLADGALQIFGAGLNFASFAAKAASSKNINPHEMLYERFKWLKDELES